jgi:hypothetical protein
MARAFVLGLISAVACAAPALAGSAPVAYYPSLGYGQTPPPAASADAPPRPDHAPPPPGGFARRPSDRDDHWAERRERYERRREFEDGDRAYAASGREVYEDDSGWRMRRPEGPPPGPREHAAGYGEHIPDSFFADTGGVGPDEIAWVGGGGAYVVSGASAGAYASASAYANAGAHVSVRLGHHGGGGHPSHGCGCKR